MSFVDEMKQINADYEDALAHRDDKLVASWLDKLKSRIKAEISRGKKNVSENGFLLGSVSYPEYASFAIQEGLITAKVRWSLTPKMEACLKSLTAAAQKDGISITGYSFSVWNSHGDDSFCLGSFSEPLGNEKVSRDMYRLYRSHVSIIEDWEVLVNCTFSFSL